MSGFLMGITLLLLQVCKLRTIVPLVFGMTH